METAADFRQQCGSCDASSARCWCLDCSEALCDVCVSAHRRVTLTRSHQILNQPPAGGDPTPPIKFCRLHPSEPLKLYCFTCDQLTCRDCQLTAHMNHRYQFVREALDAVKQQLVDQVQPIRAQGDTVRQSLLDMKTRLKDIVCQGSNLSAELQQSYSFLTRMLKQRLEDILKQAKEVCVSECQRIQTRIMQLQQLQQNQQLVTEILKKARNTNNLSALRTYATQVESGLKNLLDQDLSPPETMSELKIITDRASLEALLNFGALQVSWVPFSISQTSNQNTPAAASSSPPPTSTSTCLVPQTGTTCVPPVPVSRSSASPKSSFSSTVAPPTSTCPAPFRRTLPQIRNTCDADSPVPVTCPSASWKSSSNQLRLPPSSVLSVNHTKAPVTTTTAGASTGTVRQLSCPHPIAPRQNLPAVALLNDVQPVYQVSCVTLLSAAPQFPTLHVVPGDTWPKQHKSLMGNVIPEQFSPASVSCRTLPVTATGNQISVGPIDTAPHQPLRDISFTATSCPPSSDQHIAPDISPRSSSLRDQQQSPVVRAVADSACDCSVQQVAERRQEPAENEPTSTVSEEPAPAEEPEPEPAEEPELAPEVSDGEPEKPEPEVLDGEAEGPSSVIGHPGRQLRVSLLRLPVSPPRPGCPLPCFRLITGETEDELYLQEMSEDTQSHAGDITGDIIDELPSSPESPATLVMVTCSACRSANGSIICSFCGRGYHRDCHVPPIGPDIRSELICSLCQDLSDPSDPFSSDRPRRPQSPSFSLQDQRRCEALLLHLKVESCTRLPQSQLSFMSERLTLRRHPSYQSAAEFLSDVWRLFKDASQGDDVLARLQDSLRTRWNESLSSESPTADGGTPAVTWRLGSDAPGGERVAGLFKRSEVKPEEQEVTDTRKSKVTETRKRLRELLVLMEASRAKRVKKDKMEA